jgi:hypothetical protein
MVENLQSRQFLLMDISTNVHEIQFAVPNDQPQPEFLEIEMTKKRTKIFARRQPRNSTVAPLEDFCCVISLEQTFLKAVGGID